MNRYQKAIVAMAVIDILLLLLFPPFLDSPLQRGVPRGFDGFYFLFMAPAGRHIHEPLLTMEVFFVVANALAASLFLAGSKDRQPALSEIALARGLLLFAVVNLVLILLFPPFEPYASLFRTARQEGFDGFYFMFGDKRHRQIFLPFLYLEVIFVAINILSAWLMLNPIRGTLSTADEHLIKAAHHLAPEKVNALLHVLEKEAATKPDAAAKLGRHNDRRQHHNPDFRSAERRTGRDRRDERH